MATNFFPLFFSLWPQNFSVCAYVAVRTCHGGCGFGFSLILIFYFLSPGGHIVTPHHMCAPRQTLETELPELGSVPMEKRRKRVRQRKEGMALLMGEGVAGARGAGKKEFIIYIWNFNDARVQHTTV